MINKKALGQLAARTHQVIVFVLLSSACGGSVQLGERDSSNSSSSGNGSNSSSSGNNEQQSTTTSSGSNASGSGGGGTRHAVASKGSDGFPVPVPPAYTVDPDALVLSFTNVDQTCGFVMPSDISLCTPDDEWQLALAIPPELDRPALIDLRDLRIHFYFTTHIATTHIAGCNTGSYGSGPGYSGTLEIVASDASTVTVRLHDTRPSSANTSLTFDGDYVAPRCGSTPPAFAPTPGVAVSGASLTSDPTSDHGAPPDPSALYVFVGTTPGTCADPQPTVDCKTNRQMVLSLPPALQVPGEVALNDPQIHFHWDSCGAPRPNGGTVTIVSKSATQMTIRIYGAEPSSVDGDYAVTICP